MEHQRRKDRLEFPARPCLNFPSRMESSGRSALVSMVKTADLRNGHDAACVGSLHRVWSGNWICMDLQWFLP